MKPEPKMVIYKVTNLVNQRIYVGQTTTGISQRWYSHVHSAKQDRFKNCLMAQAIKKYGRHNELTEKKRQHFIAMNKKANAARWGSRRLAKESARL